MRYQIHTNGPRTRIRVLRMPYSTHFFVYSLREALRQARRAWRGEYLMTGQMTWEITNERGRTWQFLVRER